MTISLFLAFLPTHYFLTKFAVLTLKFVHIREEIFFGLKKNELDGFISEGTDCLQKGFDGISLHPPNV